MGLYFCKSIKKNTYRITTLVIVLSIIFSGTLGSYAGIIDSANAEISKDIVITVNGESVPFKAAIINGSSYLPVQVIGYALNSTVEWKDGVRYIMLQTQNERLPYQEFGDLVSIDSGNRVAHFVDDMQLYLNGKYNEYVSSQIAVIESRSYLPVRAVSEQLGIRSTWNPETRTIEIVNPRTAEVSEIDEPYYVYDLPVIEKQEDYLVGNWKGYDSFTDLDEEIIYRTDNVQYISRNANGTYKIVNRLTFNDAIHKELNGKNIIEEYNNCKFSRIDNSLSRSEAEYRVLQNDLSDKNIHGATAPFYLDGEVLTSNYNNDTSARYQRY